MNTTSAEGLPELPEPAGHDGIPAFNEFYTADQMRAYGELCRAAPAGGDGLRLLVKELRESLEGAVRVADRQTDEFDRAREAIARAAHVFVNAGDSEAQFIADSRDLNCPACGGSGHVDDSAPAGSGEVEEVLKKCDSVLNDMRPISPCLTEQMEGYFAEIRALLRKLQQGA